MFLIFYRVLMRVIEKIEVSKLKCECVVVTQNFLFNYSLFKIILNPSKKVEFSSENQKDMSVDGTFTLNIYSQHWVLRLWVKRPICI